MAVAVLSGIVSFFFSKDLIRLLLKTAGIKVYYLTLPEVFLTTVEVAMYAGVFFALPVIIYLAWHEFHGATGIKPVYGWLFVFFAIVLFYGGSIFCYFVVLPSGIKFLVGNEGGVIKAMISVQRFAVFCAAMIFAFGITFEVPIILLVLSKMGLVKSKTLTKTRRFAVLFIAVAAAMITPTPDIYNMMLLAVPTYVLYEVGIILMRIVEKKAAEKSATDNR
ncbi:MAG: Sec-independent protein translocase protein TatC [Syntrophorhabdus sp. PtaU1.Bin058]|nr:MAG: Sec-independent protein translocase protein TatC [Syntrophorhabdus sp. PtaU1.Bin058]